MKLRRRSRDDARKKAESSGWRLLDPHQPSKDNKPFKKGKNYQYRTTLSLSLFFSLKFSQVLLKRFLKTKEQELERGRKVNL